MTNQNNPQDLATAIGDANNILDSFKKSKISDYISSLVAESIKISKRQNADSVSQSHIEQANDQLVVKRRGKYNYLGGTVGGILLGATISNVFGMMVLNTAYSLTGIVTTVVIGIVGTFLVAFNLNNS